ncbi:DUF6631 family protein [Methyloversatilis discipulorum]|uniref:DUF6631 family protein n=1 Tax=Methyloversatilis discipulorum TaxID=1119528 RepID=UPI000373DEF7|nr:DUF6631 family protein [Methyloversatilis discipulorum]
MSEQAAHPAPTDLDVLVQAVDEPLNVGGKTITVRPIRVKVLSRFAQAVLPLAQAFAPVIDGKADLTQISLKDLNLQDLIVWHASDVILAVSLATGEPEEWVGELDPAELIQVAAEVLAVNMNFFVQRLAPMLLASITRIGAARVAGPTPSSSSSSTATAAPT